MVRACFGATGGTFADGVNVNMSQLLLLMLNASEVVSIVRLPAATVEVIVGALPYRLAGLVLRLLIPCVVIVDAAIK